LILYIARAISAEYTELDAEVTPTVEVDAITAGASELDRNIVPVELLLSANSSSILFWKPIPLTRSLRMATSLVFCVAFFLAFRKK
jgi:hypothetical protein